MYSFTLCKIIPSIISKLKKQLFIVVNVDYFLLSHRKEIAIAAKESGYDVTVIAGDTGVSDQIRALGVHYINLPINRTGKNIFDEIKTFLFLFFLYLRKRPGLIHHVGLKPITWGSLAARLLGIPCMNAVSGTGILFEEESKKKLMTRAVCSVLRYSLRSKKARVIFQNTTDRNEFVSNQIIEENQTILIKGSGVDLERIQYRDESEIDSEKIKIVFAGRMVEQKGIQVLVDAAKILKPSYGNKICFWLCGRLDTNPYSYTRTEIDSLCDGDYIRWLGHCEDIFAVMRQCHIMAFPSYYMEGLPKAVIDAEAVGLPVITCDSVGCRDTVIDGYNGFLIPIKDSKALAERIRKLVDDPDLRRSMGENSRKYAEENFSVKDVVNKHLDVYASLLN